VRVGKEYTELLQKHAALRDFFFWGGGWYFDGNRKLAWKFLNNQAVFGCNYAALL
jgi:hypothetical protein